MPTVWRRGSLVPPVGICLVVRDDNEEIAHPRSDSSVTHSLGHVLVEVVGHGVHAVEIVSVLVRVPKIEAQTLLARTLKIIVTCIDNLPERIALLVVYQRLNGP